ncbi:hypothetical protein [Mycobacterium parmense]|uniref:hypothetical protein n=1 Tax=Mycobacterium parmense TaxID=185642 RepID=UPI000A1555CF|nr:hypothetical protein [Mycobacterium parmense]ORW49684.1 hypothetical protein AWC20_03620 [Mycobacterium parmense]
MRKLHDALIAHNIEDADEDWPKIISALVSKVTDAGIDGEALVRFGLSEATAFALIVDVVLGNHVDGAKQREWRDALEIRPAPADTRDRKAITRALTRAVDDRLSVARRWIHHAPFNDILAMTPPSSDLAKQIAESPDPPSEVCVQYTWIAERLSGQPLKQWSTESLEAEYEWRRGRQPAQIPSAALIELEHTTEDFALQIADRNVSRKRDPYDPIAEHVTDKARSLLRDRRYSDAAALFEFVGDHSKLRKSNCLNNRGFCWIPPDPKKAMYYLQQAASRGYEDRSVNTYNQMCCAVSLGDYPEFRALSERYWAEEFEEEKTPATLWVRDQGQWTLQEVPDAREQIARLALYQAEAEGWPTRVDRWTMRLEALLNGEYVL